MPEQLQARQPGGGEDDGVVVAAAQAVHARRHVAAQLRVGEVRPRAHQEGAAAQAAGADARAGRQLRKGRAVAAEEGVAGIGARQRGGEREPGVKLGGEVLEAVHGDVDAALKQRPVDFLGEEGAAAGLPQRHLALHIPRRLDVHQLRGRRAVGGQQRLEVVGLPERERGGARADAQRARAHGVPSFRKR